MRTLALHFRIIKQKQDYFNYPVFHEGTVISNKAENGGMLKYYGYWSTSTLGYTTADIDSSRLRTALELDNLNTYQNLNLREILETDGNCSQV